jgi:hypothetical protein
MNPAVGNGPYFLLDIQPCWPGLFPSPFFRLEVIFLDEMMQEWLTYIVLLLAALAAGRWIYRQVLSGKQGKNGTACGSCSSAFCQVKKPGR